MLEIKILKQEVKMNKQISRSKLMILSIIIVSALVMGACAPLSAVARLGDALTNDKTMVESTAQAVQVMEATPMVNEVKPQAVGENSLQQLYVDVNPSVVNIQVSKTGGVDLPFELPQSNNQQPPIQQALGSGFVWDKEGRIVTNNHVVENATEIEVIFETGRIYTAELVGADPASDLAVIKIDAPSSELIPVTVADSDTVQVGDTAVAIGNPFGLDGTMTVGIISALGRSLPVQSFDTNGTYSIPDIIQTDAAINPGNSGGVLLNELGQVIGVTTAITSDSNSNAGIGYAVPSNIVRNVVPVLISDGTYQHAWLGISGGTLQADIAEAMGLDRETQGILVNTIVPDGPADVGGLRGSDTTYEYKGVQISIGGDIITAIDGLKVTSFDDLVSYLARETQPGQEITLDILRDGKAQQLTVTLGARPTVTQQPQAAVEEPTAGQVYLGIMGGTLVEEVANAMDLDSDQQGVLIVEIAKGSPAEEAGLIGSTKPLTIRGQEILIGGDVITAVDDTEIDGIETLRQTLQNYEPGDVVTLTIIRNQKTTTVEVTLSSHP
jgi:S1-C subfamily serine protease